MNDRPQLPALSYLEVGDVKREDTGYQDRKMGPPITAASPTYQYPTGPPPPYNSHPAPASGNGWTPLKSGVRTPPVSRRASGEESESAKQNTRQSLPSLSEALGVDGHTPYQAAPPTHLPRPKSPGAQSPTATIRRPYGIDSTPHQEYAAPPLQQYSSFRQDSAGPQPYLSRESAKPAIEPQSETRAPLHLETTHSTPRQSQPTAHPHAPPTSMSHDHSSSNASAGSMPPPPSTFGYGYASYTPRYAQSNPPSSQGTGPIYSPSAQYGPPPPASTGWRADPARYSTDERSPQIYGESVKRHIDLYDLEAALSEVDIPDLHYTLA